MNKSEDFWRPELPPEYEYVHDGMTDSDIDILRVGVQNYRLALVAWYNPRLNCIRQRKPTTSISQISTFFSQDVKNEEEGLSILAARLWLGMTE